MLVCRAVRLVWMCDCRILAKRGVRLPPPRAAFSISARSRGVEVLVYAVSFRGMGVEISIRHTIVVVCHPEGGFLLVSEFAHPVQIDVKGLDCSDGQSFNILTQN